MRRLLTSGLQLVDTESWKTSLSSVTGPPGQTEMSWPVHVLSCCPQLFPLRGSRGNWGKHQWHRFCNVLPPSVFTSLILYLTQSKTKPMTPFLISNITGWQSSQLSCCKLGDANFNHSGENLKRTWSLCFITCALSKTVSWSWNWLPVSSYT